MAAMTMPVCALQAQAISNQQEMKRTEKMIQERDSEIHEYIENDKEFSSLFVDHDPSQCIDKSQFYIDYLNFIEDSALPAHTILEDLPEDTTRYDRHDDNAPTNALSQLSDKTLLFLAASGDTMAQHALNFRNGHLARTLGIEMTIEQGRIERNGHLTIEYGWAGHEEAEYIRNKLRS